MEKTPKYLVRPSDFTVFIKIEETGEYAIKDHVEKFPDGLFMTYSYDILIEKGWFPCEEKDFEDLKQKQNQFYDFLKWSNRPDGHGGINGGTFEEYLKTLKN